MAPLSSCKATRPFLNQSLLAIRIMTYPSPIPVELVLLSTTGLDLTQTLWINLKITISRSCVLPIKTSSLNSNPRSLPSMLKRIIRNPISSSQPLTSISWRWVAWTTIGCMSWCNRTDRGGCSNRIMTYMRIGARARAVRALRGAVKSDRKRRKAI